MTALIAAILSTHSKADAASTLLLARVPSREEHHLGFSMAMGAQVENQELGPVRGRDPRQRRHVEQQRQVRERRFKPFGVLLRLPAEFDNGVEERLGGA